MVKDAHYISFFKETLKCKVKKNIQQEYVSKYFPIPSIYFFFLLYIS